MRRPALLFCTFLLLGLAVYGSSLSNAFVIWDDDSLITENPIVADFSAGTVRAAFTSYDPELYIPLTLVTFQIENALFGLDPFFFHLDNLLLHALNAVLVLSLLERLGLRRGPALIAGLAFLLHPLNTEAAVWASARKDLLCTAFLLGSMLRFVAWRDTARTRDYLLAVLLALLAMLSKALAIVLPVAILLADMLRSHRWSLRDIGRYAPFAAFSALFFVIGIFGKTENIHALTPLQTVLLAAKATAWYPAMFAWPSGLSILYPQIAPVTAASAEFLLPLLLCLASAGAAILACKRLPWITAGLAWYVLFLLPSFSNFSKAGDLYVMSDRYPYVAQIGLLLILGVAAQRYLRRAFTRPASVVCAAALLVLGVTAHARAAVWKDSETLFRDALAKNDTSVVMHYNLGVIAFFREDDGEAVRELRRAIELNPDYGDAYRVLARIALRGGDLAGAVGVLRDAAARLPDDPQILNDLGALLTRQGMAADAVPYLERAIAVSPWYPEAHANLGEAYGKVGRYEDAVRALNEAKRLRGE